jgi:uncharacterized membrane protein YqjE
MESGDVKKAISLCTLLLLSVLFVIFFIQKYVSLSPALVPEQWKVDCLVYVTCLLMIITSVTASADRLKSNGRISREIRRLVKRMSQQAQPSSPSRKAFPGKMLAATIIVITIVAAIAAAWYLQSRGKSWVMLDDWYVDGLHSDTQHYTTDTFLTTGDEWKITSILRGYYSLCSIKVVDEYTDNVVREIRVAGPSQQMQNVTYFNTKGRFHLDVTITPSESEPSWQWHIYVHDYR